jgi:hypothetical protein
MRLGGLPILSTRPEAARSPDSWSRIRISEYLMLDEPQLTTRTFTLKPPSLA